MNSLILKVCARLVIPVLGLMTVFYFLVGHGAPGGGFIGGLVLGTATALRFFSDRGRFQSWSRISAVVLLICGLSSALGSGLFSLAAGKDFMQGVWTDLPFIGTVGTPLFFDFGVLLVVAGMVLWLVELVSEFRA